MSMPDPYNERQVKPDAFEDVADRNSGSAWPWLAGAALIVAVVMALTFGTSNNDQAGTTPTTTTGQAPITTPSDNTGAAPRAPAPAEAPRSEPAPVPAAPQ